MAATVMELYGSKVFNEHEMRERLPSSTYKSLKATIEKGQPLDLEVANVVASVMKRWAIEQGATHYTHWFQPLTGITSEKHDGFVSPQPIAITRRSPYTSAIITTPESTLANRRKDSETGTAI